jgi:hypothetical protein
MDVHYIISNPRNKDEARPVEPSSGSIGHLLEEEGGRMKLRFNFPLKDIDGSYFEIAHAPEHAWVDLWYDKKDLVSTEIDRGDYLERMISICDYERWSFCERVKMFRDGYSGVLTKTEPHAFSTKRIEDLYSGNHLKIILRSSGVIEFRNRVCTLATKQYKTVDEAMAEWDLLRSLAPLCLLKDLPGLNFDIKEELWVSKKS